MTDLYVRKDLRAPSADACPHCTRWSSGGKACVVVSCLACGSPQCHSNGGARGTCSVCLVGVLPGWSGSQKPCGYKGCTRRGIMEAPRMGRICGEHALTCKRPKGYGVKVALTMAQFVWQQTEARANTWRLITSTAVHQSKTWCES